MNAEGPDGEGAVEVVVVAVVDALYVVVVFVVFFATVGAIVVWVTLLSKHRI